MIFSLFYFITSRYYNIIEIIKIIIFFNFIFKWIRLKLAKKNVLKIAGYLHETNKKHVEGVSQSVHILFLSNYFVLFCCFLHFYTKREFPYFKQLSYDYSLSNYIYDLSFLLVFYWYIIFSLLNKSGWNNLLIMIWFDYYIKYEIVRKFFIFKFFKKTYSFQSIFLLHFCCISNKSYFMQFFRVSSELSLNLRQISISSS